MRELLRTLRSALDLYRCFVCGRVRLLHTAGQVERCDTTPLPVEITPAGLAHLAALEGNGEDLQRDRAAG
jgi:hypothetical protein